MGLRYYYKNMIHVPGVRVKEAAKQEKLIKVYAIKKKLDMTRAIMLRSPNEKKEGNKNNGNN